MAGADEIPQTLIHYSEKSDGAVMVEDSVIFPWPFVGIYFLFNSLHRMSWICGIFKQREWNTDHKEGPG